MRGDYIPKTRETYPFYSILNNPNFSGEEDFLFDFFNQLLKFQESSIQLGYDNGYIDAAKKAIVQYNVVEKPNFTIPRKKEPSFYLKTRKMKYKINDIVKLATGKALIVGTKEEPFYSVAFRTNYFPENGFDYVILHHTGKNRRR